jgi:uncharacterized protein (TIGR00270 family)
MLIQMGACELCGAEKVGTRAVKMGRAVISACSRCIEKMNLELVEKPKSALSQSTSSKTKKFSGGYGGRGQAGSDVMVRGEKELADDFAKRIVDARKKLGLDKRQLGHKIAEKVNVIQAAESGKRPTDALIKKLERFLKIELMVETTVEETSMVGVGSSRGLTLGDFFKQNE